MPGGLAAEGHGVEPQRKRTSPPLPERPFRLPAPSSPQRARSLPTSGFVQLRGRDTAQQATSAAVHLSAQRARRLASGHRSSRPTAISTPHWGGPCDEPPTTEFTGRLASAVPSADSSAVNVSPPRTNAAPIRQPSPQAQHSPRGPQCSTDPAEVVRQQSVEAEQRAADALQEAVRREGEAAEAERRAAEMLRAAEQLDQQARERGERELAAARARIGELEGGTAAMPTDSGRLVDRLAAARREIEGLQATLLTALAPPPPPHRPEDEDADGVPLPQSRGRSAARMQSPALSSPQDAMHRLRLVVDDRENQIQLLEAELRRRDACIGSLCQQAARCLAAVNGTALPPHELPFLASPFQQASSPVWGGGAGYAEGVVCDEASGREAVTRHELRSRTNLGTQIDRVLRPFGLPGYFGVTVRCDGAGGVTVTGTEPASPAELSGVTIGDRVVGVQAPHAFFHVNSQADFHHATGQRGHVFVGTEVELHVVREHRYDASRREWVRDWSAPWSDEDQTGAAWVPLPPPPLVRKLSVRCGMLPADQRETRVRSLDRLTTRFGHRFRAEVAYSLSCEPTRCAELLQRALRAVDDDGSGRLDLNGAAAWAAEVARLAGVPAPAPLAVETAYRSADCDDSGSVPHPELQPYIRGVVVSVIFGDAADSSSAAQPPPSSVGRERNPPPRPASRSRIGIGSPIRGLPPSGSVRRDGMHTPQPAVQRPDGGGDGGSVASQSRSEAPRSISRARDNEAAVAAAEMLLDSGAAPEQSQAGSAQLAEFAALSMMTAADEAADVTASAKAAGARMLLHADVESRASGGTMPPPPAAGNLTEV
eukprot:TRINITY_DN15238_c0_g1_i2.p1 TRINITY_DN15238_c0_g1~~TRINITY_DN15238_c0_g1_i2.p1  ORF type:complete len:885 (+),score=181.94 TRINITY_DN15238_c0_g1_i2:182-2656(+)